MISTHLTETPLDTAAIIASVQNERCGAIDVFIGTVRNETKGKAVLRLEYEAYEPMALKEMQSICEEAQQRWNAHAITAHHRLGTIEPGGIAVVVAVSTPHRADAFAACQLVIDTLKERVPIWKKEVFEDGETWVTPHA
ncbi:MAG: molybdenum cofactor biosynthesis protein MoaE [Candidatus Kapabacteria bacterium]|jgi:molybdopterin synthase catalytic subunit|nr:molybdenum cofactor biosynthesis protein MoaE [Candidatus Kapabacteria bacterium]